MLKELQILNDKLVELKEVLNCDDMNNSLKVEDAKKKIEEILKRWRS
jgi:hypothetical protein